MTSARVVVVDDERTIADTLVLILQKRGLDAFAFYSPLAALEAVAAIDPTYLVTDIVMPEVDGIALAMKVQRLCPECRVILMSGNAMYAGRELPGLGFPLLHKPVHPEQLLALLTPPKVSTAQ